MTNYLPAVISSLRQPDSFDRQIDRLFDEALRTFGASDLTWTPACNAWEDHDGFYVQVGLPGWEPKDVSLEVDKQVLLVKGERKSESEPAPAQSYHLREIAADRFLRMFKLPSFVDQDKASASHKNGLLTITFPKREEAKRRRIVIEG